MMIQNEEKKFLLTDNLWHREDLNLWSLAHRANPFNTVTMQFMELMGDAMHTKGLDSLRPYETSEGFHFQFFATAVIHLQRTRRFRAQASHIHRTFPDVPIAGQPHHSTSFGLIYKWLHPGADTEIVRLHQMLRVFGSGRFLESKLVNWKFRAQRGLEPLTFSLPG